MSEGMDAKYCVNCDTLLLDEANRPLSRQLDEQAECCDNPIVRFVTPQGKPEGVEAQVIPNGE